MVWSDNGTNFQGASTELQNLFSTTSSMSQEIAAELANDKVEWTFIPPRAPHFGGIWEANIKSFKQHLVKAVGDTKLTYEEFSTVSTMVEACLNSRPMCPLSNSDEDVSALTPGHFLIGAPLVAPVEPFEEVNVNKLSALSRWNRVIRIRNHLWDRWKKEYLLQLQARSKWLYPNRSFEIGDLVIIRDELYPPCKWPLARITNLYPGQDGLSRVAQLKTQHSELKRPNTRLIYLPANDTASVNFIQVLSAMVGGLEP